VVDVTVTILGTQEAVDRLVGMTDVISQRITQALNDIGVDLSSYIKEQKLSGQVLKNRTGTLRRSVNYEVHTETSPQYVEVGTRGLDYAAIHEFGGRIPDRRPVNAKALHWIAPGGGDVFAMFARGFTMPERSYMRSSLDEKRDLYVRRIEMAMRDL
jgi:phage gpG-like protein